MNLKCILLYVYSVLLYFGVASWIEQPKSNSIAWTYEHALPDLIIDIILAEVKGYLKDNNETSIPIPPVNLVFQQNFIGIEFDEYFNASGGVFRNPTTITRKGPSNIKRNNSSFVLSFEIGFKDMDIYFSNYTASFGLLSESGDVFVNVGQNAVFIEVTVKFLPRCIVRLTDVKLVEFNQLTVRITGLGILNSFENQIIEWVLSSYKTSFTTILEQVIQNKLQEEFAKTSLCKFKRQKMPK